jgi:pimeloyl-ACP methyl ester carboxylesterase
VAAQAELDRVLNNVGTVNSAIRGFIEGATMPRLFQYLRCGFQLPGKNPGLASISILAILHFIGANAAALNVVNPNQRTAGNVTVKPIVFEVRDQQKVEAESGQLLVPEKRGPRRSKMISLAFIRFKSRAQNPAATIVYLAGGPGDSGINDFRAIPLPLLNDLRSVADVIALDQRGTGDSEPRKVTCAYEQGLPLDRPGDPELFARIFRERMRDCSRNLKHKGVDLAAFTTDENADDIEALRVALGLKKLTLLAGSYGSHLGLAVIRRHPNSIERAIVFGTEGLDQTFKLPGNVQANLEKLAALVRADSFYSRSMPDLLEAIRTVMERLDRQPAIVRVGRDISVVVGKWDLQKRIADVMGRASGMRQLPAAIYDMLSGDFTDLGRWAYGYRRAISLSAMAVTMDCASFASTARLERIRREAGSAMVGAVIDFPFPAICEGLNLPRLGDEFRAPLHSSLPVLFISGEMDGRTPVSNAQEVAAGFPNHQHLIVENAGHGILGYPELTPAVMAFLRGQPIPQSRVSFPKWELTHPAGLSNLSQGDVRQAASSTR